MIMKKTIAAICALVLFAQVACVSNVKPQNTPAPTAQITAAPTGEPTAVPTDSPTAAPSAVPTAEPLVFPTPSRLGNLVNGGSVLPEGMAYFVLDGESDIHYVYDHFGELLTTFTAPSDDFNCWSDSAGIYGEYGVPYGYCIKRGEMMPADIIDFANRLFEYRKIWDDERTIPNIRSITASFGLHFGIKSLKGASNSTGPWGLGSAPAYFPWTIS